MLQSLTSGGVWCSLENEVVNGYFYADRQPFDGNRRHIFTRPRNNEFGAAWRITFLQ